MGSRRLPYCVRHYAEVAATERARAVRLKNSPTHYGHVGRTLHWTSVALIVAVVYFGQSLDGLSELERLRINGNHVGFGLLLLVLMIVRFTWRQRNANPVLSYSIRRWQKRSAVSVHWFLYAAVVMQCLIGIAQLVAERDTLAIFDRLIAWDWQLHDAVLRERLNDVHAAIANVIYVAVAVHVTAAIYHQIFGVLDPDEHQSLDD